jgi:hypothetical protein
MSTQHRYNLRSKSKINNVLVEGTIESIQPQNNALSIWRQLVIIFIKILGIFSFTAFSLSAFSSTEFSSTEFSPTAFSPTAFSPTAFSPTAYIKNINTIFNMRKSEQDMEEDMEQYMEQYIQE